MYIIVGDFNSGHVGFMENIDEEWNSVREPHGSVPIIPEKSSFPLSLYIRLHY